MCMINLIRKIERLFKYFEENKFPLLLQIFDFIINISNMCNLDVHD